MSGIWSALVHQLTRYLHNLKIRGGGQRDPQYFYHLSLFSSNSLKSLLNLCLAVTVGQHLSQVQEEIGQLNESQDQTKTVVNQLELEVAKSELDRQRLEAIVAKSELELQRLKHERELDRQRLEALMEKSELDRQRLEHERELDQQRLEATEAKLKMLMDKLSLV